MFHFLVRAFLLNNDHTTLLLGFFSYTTSSSASASSSTTVSGTFEATRAWYRSSTFGSRSVDRLLLCTELRILTPDGHRLLTRLCERELLRVRSLLFFSGTFCSGWSGSVTGSSFGSMTIYRSGLKKYPLIKISSERTGMVLLFLKITDEKIVPLLPRQLAHFVKSFLVTEMGHLLRNSLRDVVPSCAGWMIYCMVSVRLAHKSCTCCNLH